MLTYAKYQSLMTPQGRKIFRYHTEFRSDNGPGDAIGLVYMMNPGDARPASDHLFDLLQTKDTSIAEPVLTKPDRTMSKVTRLIQEAYAYNGKELPEAYTIHVENLFNLREKDSKQAQKLVSQLRSDDTDNLMYLRRNLVGSYKFVLLAWGQVTILADKRRELLDTFPHAITVHKRNQKGGVLEIVDYPIHPLYVNTDYFLEASQGKILG